jgi:hypothetical protein
MKPLLARNSSMQKLLYANRVRQTSEPVHREARSSYRSDTLTTRLLFRKKRVEVSGRYLREAAP